MAPTKQIRQTRVKMTKVARPDPSRERYLLRSKSSSVNYTCSDSDTEPELSHEIYGVKRIDKIKKLRGRRVGQLSRKRELVYRNYEYLDNTVNCEKLIEECEVSMKENNEVESEIEEDSGTEDEGNFSGSDISMIPLKGAHVLPDTMPSASVTAVSNFKEADRTAPAPNAHFSGSLRTSQRSEQIKGYKSRINKSKGVDDNTKPKKSTPNTSSSAKTVERKRLVNEYNPKSKKSKVATIDEDFEIEQVDLVTEAHGSVEGVYQVTGTDESVGEVDTMRETDDSVVPTVRDTSISVMGIIDKNPTAVVTTETVIMTQPCHSHDSSSVQVSAAEMLYNIQNYQMQANLSFALNRLYANSMVPNMLNAQLAYNWISQEARLSVLSDALAQGLCAGTIPSSFSQGLSMSPLSSMIQQGLSMYPLYSPSQGLCTNPLNILTPPGLDMNPLNILAPQGLCMDPLIASQGPAMTAHNIAPRRLGVIQSGSSSGSDLSSFSALDLQGHCMNLSLESVSQEISVQQTVQSVPITSFIPPINVTRPPGDYMAIGVVNGVVRYFCKRCKRSKHSRWYNSEKNYYTHAGIAHNEFLH